MADPITYLEVEGYWSGGAARVRFETPSDCKQVVIRRKEGSAPTGPADGTLVEGVQMDAPPGYAFAVDTDLANGTTYHYGVWSHDGAAFSAMVTDSVTPAYSAVSDQLDLRNFWIEQLKRAMPAMLTANRYTLAPDRSVLVGAAYVEPDDPNDLYPLVSVHLESRPMMKQMLSMEEGEEPIGQDNYVEKTFEKTQTCQILVVSDDVGERDQVSKAVEEYLDAASDLLGDLGWGYTYTYRDAVALLPASDEFDYTGDFRVVHSGETHIKYATGAGLVAAVAQTATLVKQQWGNP